MSVNVGKVFSRAFYYLVLLFLKVGCKEVDIQLELFGVCVFLYGGMIVFLIRLVLLVDRIIGGIVKERQQLIVSKKLSICCDY